MSESRTCTAACASQSTPAGSRRCRAGASRAGRAGFGRSALAVEIKALRRQRRARTTARERFGDLVAHPAAPRRPHRVSVPARRRRRRRGRAGRVRQGVHAHQTIARTCRSRSGSRGSSSTAASTAARRAAAPRCAGARRPMARRPRTRGAVRAGAAATDPEARLLARERRAQLAAAVDRAAGPAARVFMLCHFGEQHAARGQRGPGLSEATVRVHLFRAAAQAARLLGGKP